MDKENKIMKLQGFDLNSKACELKREQPRSYSTPTGKHYGMPVSTKKFLMMLFEFWRQNTPTADNPLKDVFWVDFSKASLFRILAQEQCEFVRFYFAIPDSGILKASLALEGIMDDGSPIKLAEILAVAATMNSETTSDIEANGGGTFGTGAKLAPAHEEKGNGGPPLVDGDNISSLVDFIGKQGGGFLDDDFKKFIETYYRYAKEKFS